MQGTHSNIYIGMVCILYRGFMAVHNQSGLENDVGEITEYVRQKQKLFDVITDRSREIIRLAAQSITYTHNNRLDDAAKVIAAAHKLVGSKEFKDERFGYYTTQAQQEYAEAMIFFNIKSEGRIPNLKDVGVSREAYLLGLMDCVGELKREVLEELRDSNVKKAEEYFGMMRHIYDTTRPVRFAEAVLQGFRKKQDVARIQIENAGTEILSSGKRN